MPDIVAVNATRVSYAQPRPYYEGTLLKQVREAVELLVRTSAELPIRAVLPVLFVGETAIPEFETVGSNQYRFIAYDIQNLTEGAAISLGWTQLPERRVRTPFRFSLRPPLTN